MTLKKKTTQFLLVSGFFLSLFISCTKIDSTRLGSGLIPPIDGVNTKDTFFDVSTAMLKSENDTFRIFKTDLHSLGTISNDPLFGTTDAQVNLQLKPYRFPFVFPKSKDSLVLDSVVLTLAWYNTFGDTLTPVQLQVHEIDPSAKFSFDSSYTNYANFNTIGSSLVYGGSSKPVYPTNIRYTDTLKVYNEAISNQIRIRLTDDFGKRFLNLYDTIGLNPVTGAYSSDSTYNKLFKGLNVKAVGGNALLEVLLADTNTKMAFYYKVRQPDNSLRDSFATYFRINAVTSASSNYIKRQMPSGLYQQALNNPAADSLLFIQSSPGHKVQLQIPGLSSMRNIVVHRAELLLDQVQPFASLEPYDKLFYPPNLFLSAYNSDSLKSFVIPYDVEVSLQGITNLGTFGGYPNKQYNNGIFSHYTYNFNLTRYVQHIVTAHQTNYKLLLYAPYFETIYGNEHFSFSIPISSESFNYPGVGRVLLGGGNYKSNPSKKARLRIIFSEL